MTGTARRDYGPRQLAGYLRAPYGRAGNARFFDLMPGPDSARGRWPAALAEQIRARWPEISAASTCTGAPGLRKRGRTEAMIRDLPGRPGPDGRQPALQDRADAALAAAENRGGRGLAGVRLEERTR